MRFSTVLVLLALLVASCGRHDQANHKIVGTWRKADSSSPSITILGDGGFITIYERTNHTVETTFRGTWQLKDGELLLTATIVDAAIDASYQHEPAGGTTCLRIIGLDSHHMTFAYQAASNYVATNTYFRRP